MFGFYINMVSINRISCVNNYLPKKPCFNGNSPQTNPQNDEIPALTPDFSVKTPMKYTKTGEMSFPYDTKAYCYKLSNGQKVVVVPHDGETVLRTYVNTGSMNEPDNIRGISHYIEHNLFNGSKGLEQGDFFKEVNKMGASTNASTGFAETNYFISSNMLNKSDLENKIKLHASMLETPLFAAEKLEKEKEIVNSEINMITANPENIAINKMLKNLYGIKTTSSDMIGGTTDNITNLTREDVINYYKNNYYPANMVTVISGNVDPDKTMELIAKYFTSTSKPSGNRHSEKFTPIQNSVREDIISDKATASTIVVGFDGASDIKDRIYLLALSRLLSLTPTSRINKELKKYGSSVLVGQEKISTDPKIGRAVIFTADSTEENCEKVLKTMFTQIGNLQNNPPSEQEMQIIKKYLLKSFAQTFETSFSTNDIIGTSILEGNEQFINDYEKIINSMTAKDLVETAKKYLDVNKASITVVHPASATENSIKKNYADISNISFSGLQAINPENVKQFDLKNNYRVILQNSKTNNIGITYNISLDNDAKARPAALAVLSKILTYGSASKNKEDFDNELALEGIENDIFADSRTIMGNMECDVTNVDKAMKSIKEVLENPRFVAEDFEIAKNKIKNDILTSEKSASKKLYAELYKGLPKGFTNEEILEDLKTLSIDDVKDLYKQIIENGKGTVAVSAPFDKKPELKNTVFQNLSEFKPVKEFAPKTLVQNFTPINEVKVLTDTNFKNQAEIIQAYKFKVNGNLKDEIALKLMNIILGGNSSSRLFNDLREKEKLAYHVRSHLTLADDTGELLLRIQTTTENKETGEQSFDNIQKSLEGFKRHIEKLKSEKVSEEELNNAKLSLKNSILSRNETSALRNIQLLKGADSPYGILKVNQLMDEIDKITADDIYNAANSVFSGKTVYSILATENSVKANEEYLKHLGMKEADK